MAKLPTLDSLGPRPTAEPVASVAVARTGFEAQALQELGATIGKISEKITESRRGAQLTDALGKATEELELKAVEFQKDQDFKTAPTRFKSTTKTIGEIYARGIDDPVVKDLFTRQYAQKALAKQLVVLQGAAKQEQDYNVSALDAREGVYAQQAAAAKTPLEREMVLNEARGDLAVMRRAGWISDVDAGKRERGLLSRVDQAVVTRDLSIDPMETARRLSTDPEYAKNLDPLSRERWVDQGFRRAETERVRADREVERERKALGDAKLKEAFDLDAKGKLTRTYVESIRDVVEPSEYRSLLKALEGGGDRKDDPAAFSELQRLAYDDPKEAERLAFQHHQAGRIKNDTLASVLNRARSVDRQEGPRTEFERSRQFLTGVFKPSPFVSDPSGAARAALVLREFDDFATSGKRTDDELRKKSDEIAKRFAIVDMVDLAKKTSVGARNDPKVQLDAIAARGTKLMADLEAKKITPDKFNREMASLKHAKDAAERALQLNGR